MGYTWQFEIKSLFSNWNEQCFLIEKLFNTMVNDIKVQFIICNKPTRKLYQAAKNYQCNSMMYTYINWYSHTLHVCVSQFDTLSDSSFFPAKVFFIVTGTKQNVSYHILTKAVWTWINQAWHHVWLWCCYCDIFYDKLFYQAHNLRIHENMKWFQTIHISQNYSDIQQWQKLQNRCCCYCFIKNISSNSE